MMRLELENFDNQITTFFENKDLDFLLTREQVAVCFESLNIFSGSKYVLSVFSHYISKFLTSRKNNLADYFQSQAGINQLLKDMSSFLADEYREDKSHEIIQEFLVHAEEIYSRLSTYFDPSKKVNFFGYGLAEGRFERNLSNFLDLQVDLIEGHDPFAQRDENIRYLGPDDKINPQTSHFMSRWVLHHVHPSERWDIIQGFISQLNKEATLIIIEEGVFKEYEKQSISERVYTALLCMSDLIFNVILRGGWGRSDQFFIQHLTNEDIKCIENSIPFDFKREIIRFQKFNFHQTVLVYKCA